MKRILTICVVVTLMWAFLLSFSKAEDFSLHNGVMFGMSKEGNCYCETHNSSQMPKGQTTPIKKQREQRSRYESGCFRSGGNRYIVA